MKVGIPKEARPGERRVAATPETTGRLRKLGFEVLVQSGAGAGAAFSDSEYETVGARLIPGARALWDESDIILKVQPPEANAELGIDESELLHEGQTLISFIWPANNQALIERLKARKANVLAMDQVPRITRAQKMDALSSMANIAGYRAVIEAASFYGRFFTGQMTAAGKVPPAKVLVIGAGVAGLSAIGAARGLGAIVRAFDPRAEVREQVQSMGAECLELSIQEEGTGPGGYAKEMSKAFLEAEMALFAEQAREVDIIITTALVPGKPSPLLITEEMVNSMRKGSVIVDLAAESGGNCQLTQPGEVILHRGVTIIGYVDLPSRLSPVASQLYGSNLVNLLADMGGAKDFRINTEDPVVRGALVLEKGELRWPPPHLEPRPKPSMPPVKARGVPSVPSHGTKKQRSSRQALLGAALALLLLGLFGTVVPRAFVSHLTVFVLACFIGWQTVWNVTPALHTPLMSVTNAISGIILIGGMVQISGPLSSPITLLSAVAVLIATINIAGGFLVTQRMLRMFHK